MDAYRDFNHVVKYEWRCKVIPNLEALSKEFYYQKIDTYPF